MKAHKLAAYFPILEGDEFDLLVEDIKKNGQMEPIVTYQGEVLDGWNRYRACESLGIVPITKEYDGDDPLSYVISANIRRRHMDVSQRAMLATEMLPEFEAEAKERHREAVRESAKAQRPAGSKSFTDARSSDQPPDWREKHFARDDAAKVFGVSGPTVQRAKRIKEEAPERVADIIKGKATVTGVDAELREAKAKENLKKFNENYPVYEAPCLDEFLEEAIEHVIQVNSVVKRFWDYPDQVDPERMKYFVRQVKRLVEIIAAKTEGVEWKQLN